MEGFSKKFIPLNDLEVYKLSQELSDFSWDIYSKLGWQEKKIIGDQFIRAVDSVGANIAEGYFRFHYLDKIKFYYISRASLAEACIHWLELLFKRKIIKEEIYLKLKRIEKELSVKLNNFIAANYKCKKNYN